MKIYLAGRFSTYERCRDLMDSLSALGHWITHDWTRTDEFVDGHPVAAAEGNAATMDRIQQQRYALDDFRGAWDAEIVVLLADTELYGALIEVGAAMASGAMVVVVNPIRHSIFWTLPQVKVVPDIEGAILAVASLSESQESIRYLTANELDSSFYG